MNKAVTATAVTCALIFGALLLVNAVYVTFVSSFTLGIVLTYLLSGCFAAFAIFFKKIPKWLKITFVICISLELILISFLFIYGAEDNVTYKEDAVIVLGAGIRGDLPSRTLRNRLDRAIEYHFKNPKALIVVSGGQGYNEKYSEAYVMEKYLVSQGVDPSIIIKEDRSTSTQENFRFTKEILDSILGYEYKTAYITNGFHIYRAGRYADSVGLKNVTHLHGSTPLATVVPDGLRESLAVLYQWVFN